MSQRYSDNIITELHRRGNKFCEMVDEQGTFARSAYYSLDPNHPHYEIHKRALSDFQMVMSMAMATIEEIGFSGLPPCVNPWEGQSNNVEGRCEDINRFAVTASRETARFIKELDTKARSSQYIK